MTRTFVNMRSARRLPLRAQRGERATLTGPSALGHHPVPIHEVGEQYLASERRLRLVMLALLAPAGVCAGHCLGYLLAIPDAAERARVLAETGHPFWLGQALPAGIAVAFSAIFALLVGHLGRDPRGRAVRRDVCTWLVSRLAVVQMIGFVTFEAVERVAVGAPLGALAGIGVLEHGLASQIAVAGLLSGAVWLLAYAAERLRPVFVSWQAPSVSPAIRVVLAQRVAPKLDPVRPLGARAPPCLP